MSSSNVLSISHPGCKVFSGQMLFQSCLGKNIWITIYYLENLVVQTCFRSIISFKRHELWFHCYTCPYWRIPCCHTYAKQEFKLHSTVSTFPSFRAELSNMTCQWPSTAQTEKGLCRCCTIPAEAFFGSHRCPRLLLSRTTKLGKSGL